MLIYKICHRAEWAEAEHAGTYSGSAKDRADGFLHFSTGSQLAGTLARYYAGAEDLLLIGFEAEAMGPALKWEPSRERVLFPHLYGALSTSAAVSVSALVRDESGNFLLPPP